VTCCTKRDYSDYKDFNGVKFPTHMIQKQGGWPTFELTVTDVKPNITADIQQPAGRGRGGRGGPGGPGAPAAGPAEPEKLSDGVYLLPGAYAAVAVDMKDGILVIEGPRASSARWRLSPRPSGSFRTSPSSGW